MGLPTGYAAPGAAPMPAPQRIAAAQPSSHSAEQQHAARQSRQALVVDDSRVIRGLSRRILEALGYTVNEAEDGQEALAKCAVAMPDLIITDWNMPVMGGIEFVQSLRNQANGNQPKVVFCTTNGDALDIHQGIAAGADHYVIKPFDEASMRASLQKIGAA